jgi:hypothetical protein
MSTAVACTDYSALLIVSSGEHYETRTIPIGIAFSIGFSSCCWFANLAVGGSGGMNIVNRINTAIRPDGYLNTSPVTVTLPIIYKPINIQQVHVIQMADFDGTDILRCRWSNSSGNINRYDECGSVCSCTIVFTLTIVYQYYAVALQIEDYYNSAATLPMSSVPLQLLFYGYPAPNGCRTPPVIIGNRPDRGKLESYRTFFHHPRSFIFLACIGTRIGSNVTEYVIVQTYCPNQTIVDFVSSSPAFMKKSRIQNPSPGQYIVRHLFCLFLSPSYRYLSNHSQLDSCS